MPASARREAILDAAIRLFADRGFRGVTTRELAAEVGVTEPVLYQHFPSKRDLYTAIIEHKMTQSGARHCDLKSLCAEDCSDHEYFSRLARLIIAWHEDDPTFIRLLLQSGLEGHELRVIFHERMSGDFMGFVSGSLATRMASGTLRQLDPNIVAYTFCAPMANYCMDRILFSPKIPAGDVVPDIVDIFINGLANK